MSSSQQGTTTRKKVGNAFAKACRLPGDVPSGGLVPFREWDPSSSVNVPEFDRHHRQLFALVNHLHEFMLQGMGRTLVLGAIEELTRYAQSHFFAEEAFMRARAFPGLAQHCAEHEAFAGQVREFKQRYDQGAVSLSVELLEFLGEWLQKHIRRADREYAPPQPISPLKP